MAHMQARAGRIRELHKGVEFLLFAAVFRRVQLFLVPDFLPFGFNLRKIVIQDKHLSYTDSSVIISLRSTGSASRHSRSRS